MFKPARSGRHDEVGSDFASWYIISSRWVAPMNTPHVYLLDKDLSETQIYVTTQTYDRFATEYSKKWEWNPVTVREVIKYNIEPFTEYVKKGGNVLIVGCQSGRDYALLTKAGFSCLGVGFSYGLLTEAVKRNPRGLFVRLDLRSLPFMPESFDGVYADALTSIPRKDIKDALKDFRIFLKSGGVLYLSLKLGTANVLEMNDLGGKRYATLYRKQEIIDIVKKIGLRIVWSAESKHTEPTLPNWFSLIAKKT